MDDLGKDSWEDRWRRALDGRADQVAQMPPHPLLVEVAEPLTPARALDAGCGHGAETIWLARGGWEVTAVDVAATALDQARSTAERAGEDVAARVEWVEADLGTWAPRAASYELVVCLYVHVAGEVGEFVTRLASGVAPGGTLVLVGHLPVDPATGQPSRAAGQHQVTLPEALAVLDEHEWDVTVAHEVPHSRGGDGADAVVVAVRR